MFKIIIAVFSIPLPAKLYHLGDGMHSEILPEICYICSWFFHLKYMNPP